VEQVNILVLSELWYPQGGGAELATLLYLNDQVRKGAKVEVISNTDVYKNYDYVNNINLPIGKSFTKMNLLLSAEKILNRVRKIIHDYDVLYLPGKMFFLATLIKKMNSKIKIVSHFHDYQIVCPHASLFDFTTKKRCNQIWNYKKCMKCIYNYELKIRGSISYAIPSVLMYMYWNTVTNKTKMLNIMSDIDEIITVSMGQAELISARLGYLKDTFLEKNTTIYNPIPLMKYIPLKSSENVTISSFCGTRYMKGFERIVSLAKASKNLIDKSIQINVVGKITNEYDELIPTNINLLGYVEDKKIYEIDEQSWINLLLSVWDEPMPYTVIESQLKGRPIIASPVGGISEAIVKTGLTGEVIENQNVLESILKYVEIIKNDPIGVTKEIHNKSLIFFNKRTQKAYEDYDIILRR
jgi:glycosyltransferase involved in cell wall biosynthesis